MNKNGSESGNTKAKTRDAPCSAKRAASRNCSPSAWAITRSRGQGSRVHQAARPNYHNLRDFAPAEIVGPSNVPSWDISLNFIPVPYQN
jgi:hypothetical protein